MSLAHPRKRTTRANISLVVSRQSLITRDPKPYLYVKGKGLDEAGYFACAGPIERHFPEVFLQVDSKPGQCGADTNTRWIVTRAQPYMNNHVGRFLRRLGVQAGDPVAWSVEAV